MRAIKTRAGERASRPACRFLVAVLLTGCCAAQTPDPAVAAYDALRARDYDRAIEAFRQALEASPDRAAIRKDLAYTYLKIGETALARDQFHEAMRADPNDAQVALEYAFLCNETRQEAEARRVFDRLRRSGSATAERAFRNIDAPLAAGIERWKKAIEMGANDFAAHYELATLAEKRDELSLAAEHYEKAWRILPSRRSVLVDLGRVWIALGRSDLAGAALLSAAYGGETRAAESAREFLPARFPYVPEFRRAVLFDPANADLRRELAYLLLRMERDAEAEVEFRYLADNFPDDLLSATQLGFLLQNRGDRKAAQPLFDRVLSGNDEDLANRVRAVLRLPQTLQSRTDAGSAPVDNKAMAERSFKAGYLKDALKYLRNAHEAEPGDYGVMLQLGWTYNILHEDTRAFEWFNKARHSPDPQIASDAEKAWRNLRFENQRFRTTGWFYPLFSARWHDGFGYAQIKTELRATTGLHFYASTRLVGDTRLGIGALPPNLSERAVILGGGVMAGPWHGLLAWGEAGTAIGYTTGHMLPDYRGGISYARGVGHGLRSEVGGLFADTAADAVFVSRFGNDTLLYDQSRFGYTFGPSAFRMQLYWNAGVTVDQQRQPWANFGETGPGLRMGSSVYFTFNVVRGIYFVRHDNPRPRTFSDFRAGMWYAFTR